MSVLVSGIDPRPPTWVGRLSGLDVFRGLAVLAMLVDHLVLVLQGPELFRLFPGRLAMPAFFLLAGHLVTRVSWRTAGVAFVGLLLPYAVPWIDSPNVLVLWAAGALLIVVLREAGLPEWPLIVVGLAMAANGYALTGPGAFEPTALIGLMALGAVLPSSAFTWAARLPEVLTRPLAAVGRAPVRWYVGHLLALQALVVVLS